MPICFAVSTGETIPAVQALVESAIAQLRNQHGLDGGLFGRRACVAQCIPALLSSRHFGSLP
eukprot:2521679-Pyramimonas_sp.AAC.1